MTHERPADDGDRGEGVVEGPPPVGGVPVTSDRSGLQRRAMRGASWTLLHTVVSLPIAFVANLLVARILGADGYGRLAFLMTFISVASGIVALGVGTGLVQFGSRAHAGGRVEDVRRLLSASQGFRLIVVAPLMSVVVLLVADIPRTSAVLAIIAGIWLPAALDGAVFCITIEQRSDLGAKIAMATNVLVQSAVVLSAWAFRTADGVWIARLTVEGLMMFVYLVTTAKPYRSAILRPTLPTRFPSGFWRFALPTGLATIIGTLALSRTEVFFLTWLSTPASVGVFALAFGLANHVFAPAEAVVGPLVPAISGLHEVDRDSLRPALERILRATSVGIALACAGGLPALAILVPLLYGPAFQDAAVPLLALGLASAILTAAGPISVFTMGRLAGRLLVVSNSAALVIDIGLALVLIPSLGIWGAVIANCAGAFTRFGVLLLTETRVLGLSPAGVARMMAPIALSASIATCAYFGSTASTLPAVLRALLAAVFSLAVLVALMRVCGVGLTTGDRNALVVTLPHRWQRSVGRAMGLVAIAPTGRAQGTT